MQNCVTSVTNKQTNKLSFCWNVQPETQILNELEPTYLVSIRWACWWMEAPLYFHIWRRGFLKRKTQHLEQTRLYCLSTIMSCRFHPRPSQFQIQFGLVCSKVQHSTPPLWSDLVKILTTKPRHASTFFLGIHRFQKRNF